MGAARHQPKTFTNMVQPHLEGRGTVQKTPRLAWAVRVHVLAASARPSSRTPQGEAARAVPA